MPADELLERNHRVLKYESPQSSDLASLRNWTESTGSLARDELEYLDKDNDLLCLATQPDSFLVRLELLLEKAVIWAAELLGRVRVPTYSFSLDTLQCGTYGNNEVYHILGNPR